MAATDTRTQREGQWSMPNVLLPKFSALAMERLKEFLKAQAEFIETIGAMNEQWYDRMQSEAKLASEFALSLTATRSVPDAVTAWQDWTGRWFGLVAEDGRLSWMTPRNSSRPEDTFRQRAGWSLLSPAAHSAGD